MNALVLIDIQLGLQETHFYGSERNNPNAEINAGKILSSCRNRNLSVFHVQHNSSNPQSPLFPAKKGNGFHPVVTPINGEPIIQKSVNSAFIGTDLEQQLKNQNITDIIIAGLTTEHCVSTSVRMAANLGFNVTLVSDATAAFDKVGVDGQKLSAHLIHNAALANLKDEFAAIKNTKTILNQLAH
ncbi:cysteine hydrolase family protein [Flagellimonas sp. S3867]|uniref:cysteine hydrolase family protein n=1 Tax=Flagellimonas sp. S3867 TaxID=2768063 RepID=UPI00168A306A|nr:cysteine hydrolase family protein [Flagellimonas sp. S3867]